MITRQWLIRAVVIGMLLTALLPAPQVSAQLGIVGGMTTVPYGTFNNVAYVMHSGRFMGLASGDYSVPFEIIAPVDPSQGNGILIVEPFHTMGGTAGLKGYLTPELIFGQGFSYAGLGWDEDGDPFNGYEPGEAIEILANFALAAREDDAVQALVGDIESVYGVGVSKTCEAVNLLLQSSDAGVLDFSFLFVPSWIGGSYELSGEAGLVMAFLTEADLVRSAMLGMNVEAMRITAENYRSYEIAGGPHVPDVPWVREISLAMFGITSEGTTPLDWTPVARALFVAGHRWASEGIEPPPSVHLADAPTGEDDPVYPEVTDPVYYPQLQTGIDRDADGNALGGVRMPDLAIGRGQYIAVERGSFFGFHLFGDWVDLRCEPSTGNKPRFRNHGQYVSQFSQATQALVKEGFLLQEDAQQLRKAAAQSEVGKPGSCP
jgi:hypothetical protein